MAYTQNLYYESRAKMGGYHTGAELQQCHDDNINTYVAFKEQPAPKAIAKSVQMVIPKHREGFCLIKNILLQLILRPTQTRKFSLPSLYFVKK